MLWSCVTDVVSRICTKIHALVLKLSVDPFVEACLFGRLGRSFEGVFDDNVMDGSMGELVYQHPHSRNAIASDTNFVSTDPLCVRWCIRRLLNPFEIGTVSVYRIYLAGAHDLRHVVLICRMSTAGSGRKNLPARADQEVESTAFVCIRRILTLWT